MITREHSSRFLRMRSRAAGHARYSAPIDRAEDFTPDHDDFNTLAALVPADDIPLDMSAHGAEGEV